MLDDKAKEETYRKNAEIGAEVRRRHSTGLTPESEKYYEHVPATFPSDWYAITGQDVMDLN